MNQDKKELGSAKNGNPEKRGEAALEPGGTSMAADKPSGGTSVGSSTSFGSGGIGSQQGTSGDKPGAESAASRQSSASETAGDKPPAGGPGTGMGGGSAMSGSRGGGYRGNDDRYRGGDARQLAQEGVEKTRDVAGQLFGDVRSAAEDMLEERKGRAAETVHGVAEALRRTASNLKGENEAIARYAEQAADTVDRFSETVRERRLGDMISDLDDFARRQPTVFLVGAVAAGFLVGRFMAAASERRQSTWGSERGGEDLISRTRRSTTPTAGYGQTGTGNISATRGTA
jgi:hypothetical protein